HLRCYPAAIRELQNEGQLRRSCRHRTRRCSNNRVESDHRHVKRRLRWMQGPRTTATAWAVIAGIEAVQMIRKGQVPARRVLARLSAGATDTATTWQRNGQNVMRSRT